MATLREFWNTLDRENQDSYTMAVEAYDMSLWDREILEERVHLDALIFSSHQEPYVTLAEFEDRRCQFDDETNEWLIRYVVGMAANVDNLPPVLIHITKDGVALVDGCHRVSALVMLTNRIRINAIVV